jgi:ATP-binding cassette subfamily F protein 3
MLDEPTTHLDIHAREALQEALSSYPGTIALVSHDIEFVRGIAKDIYDLRPGKVTRYYGDYDYYREKLAQEQAAQAAAELAANPPKPVPAIVPKNVPSAPKTVEKNVPQRSYKDQKRAESQLRQTFGKLKRPYESQVSSCEEKIAALEKEQQEIYEKLNAPTADTDFAALNKRLAEINLESENETWRWEEASTSLEKLEEEFQERLAAIQRGEV